MQGTEQTCHLHLTHRAHTDIHTFKSGNMFRLSFMQPGPGEGKQIKQPIDSTFISGHIDTTNFHQYLQLAREYNSEWRKNDYQITVDKPS